MADKSYIFRLVISGPNDYAAEFEIPIGITTIGRDADNSIQLDDRTVSRHHARLECISGECDITDLESSNGTSVNKVKISPKTPVPLKHQDRIGLGPNFEMILEQTEVIEDEIPSEEPEQPPIEEPVPPPEIKVPVPPPPPVLPTTPLPPPDGKDDLFPPGLSIQSRRLLKYLPGIYHTDFMARFLGIFEAILTPVEWTIDHFDLFLSPRTAPEAFLPWLANWYEAEFDKTWNVSQRRQFLEEAWLIYSRRGTKWSLSRVLEIYTGQAPHIDDLAEDLRPHAFRVTLPLNEGDVNRSSITALIDYYKPAHTDYELIFRG
jgi:phage tail-like protein